MPQKIFSDTNIFIRYYRNDDPKLSPLARGILANCDAGKFQLVICSVTIIEIIWLLTSFYKLPKDKIIEFVSKILTMSNLVILDRELTENTVAQYQDKNIIITDAYFCALMEQEKITEVFSFDHNFDKIRGIKRRP